jgi:hypothetical protein
MPTTNEQIEIQKMTAIANNEEQKPEVRILAARRLLRYTTFSDRSVRVAKRVAKLYFTDEDVSSNVRAKAASLLEFVLNKPEDDGSPLEVLTPAPIVASSAADAIKVKPWFNVPWYLVGDKPWCGVLRIEELNALESAVIAQLDPAQPVYVNEKDKKGFAVSVYTEYGRAAKKQFHESVLAAIERKKEQANGN